MIVSCNISQNRDKKCILFVFRFNFFVNSQISCISQASRLYLIEKISSNVIGNIEARVIVDAFGTSEKSLSKLQMLEANSVRFVPIIQ